MHIRFAEADRNFISTQTSQGFYASETEVVRDAVRRLREQKEAQQTPLYQAVMKGHQQIEQGATIPYSRELMEQINQEAVDHVKKGVNMAFDSAVIPSQK